MGTKVVTKKKRKPGEAGEKGKAMNSQCVLPATNQALDVLRGKEGGGEKGNFLEEGIRNLIG